MHTRLHVCTHAHTRARARTHTHMHTHTHTHTQVFGLAQAYVAMSEVKPIEPGQLALVQDQPVRVIDPLREDWWLVATMPEEEGVSPVEGWVPPDKLKPSHGTCMYVCMYTESREACSLHGLARQLVTRNYASGENYENNSKL